MPNAEYMLSPTPPTSHLLPPPSLLHRRPHSLYRPPMRLFARRHNPLITVQRPAHAKVERLAPHVGTHAARLGNQQRARGVIPDFLGVCFTARVDGGYTQAAESVLLLCSVLLVP